MMDSSQGTISTMVDRQMELWCTGHDRIGTVRAVADKQGLSPFFLQGHDPLDLSRTVAGVITFADTRLDFVGLFAEGDASDDSPHRGGHFPEPLFIGAAGTDEKTYFFRSWQERFCRNDAACRLDDRRIQRRPLSHERASHDELAIFLSQATSPFQDIADSHAQGHIMENLDFRAIQLARYGQVFVDERFLSIDGFGHALERFHIDDDGSGFRRQAAGIEERP